MATVGSRLRAGGGHLWLAYALWEFGVQIFAPEANIRVDLLFFYPILLIALVLGLWFGLRSRKSVAKPRT